MSTSRTASVISGTSSGAALRRALHLEHVARRQRQQPRDDPDLAGAVTNRAALEVLGPPLVLVELRRGLAGDEDLGPAQLQRGVAVRAPVEAHDRLGVEAGAADDPPLVAPDMHGRAVDEQLAGRLGDVEAAVEPVGTPDDPRNQPALGIGQASTMSTNTRRLSRAAAALTTVRIADAVRPPRPITLP